MPRSDFFAEAIIVLMICGAAAITVLYAHLQGMV